MPGFVETVISDGGLLLFTAAGLVATTIAILRDARTQRTEIPQPMVRARR